VLDEDIVREDVLVSQCQRSLRAQQLISNRARADCVFSRPRPGHRARSKNARFITGLDPSEERSGSWGV